MDRVTEPNHSGMVAAANHLAGLLIFMLDTHAILMPAGQS
jgi:hypothetical protein